MGALKTFHVSFSNNVLETEGALLLEAPSFYTVMAEAPALPKENERSCLPCRVTGAVTFTGISGWLMYERTRVPVANVGHRATLALMSVGFVGAAIARALY